MVQLWCCRVTWGLSLFAFTCDLGCFGLRWVGWIDFLVGWVHLFLLNFWDDLAVSFYWRNLQEFGDHVELSEQDVAWLYSVFSVALLCILPHTFCVFFHVLSPWFPRCYLWFISFFCRHCFLFMAMGQHHVNGPIENLLFELSGSSLKNLRIRFHAGAAHVKPVISSKLRVLRILRLADFYVLITKASNGQVFWKVTKIKNGDGKILMPFWVKKSHW